MEVSMADSKCKAIILYWSNTGNTEKVAETIQTALVEKGIEPTIQKVKPKTEVNYFDYNLIFIGAPVYGNLPPPVVSKFLGSQRKGLVFAAAPERPGHFAVVFCTYGGGHTGIRETVPTLSYMGQHLEHSGIRVVDEWAVVGEFYEISDENYNTNGRIGDIRGRPSEWDLKEIRGKVFGLLNRLKYKLPGGDER
jgi:menaquinone-dependent protoporphyrinogen IX oxidase